MTSQEQTLPRNWLGLLMLAAVFFWITGLAILSQTFFWLAEQLVLISGLDWPKWAWFIITIVQGLALLLPTGLLAIFWPNGRHRAIYRSWALGAIYILLMAPMRLVQPPSMVLANMLQIVLTTIAIGLVLLVRLRPGHPFRRPAIDTSIWLALLLAVIGSYPWLMWGALGSPLDTALNLLAALLFGVLVAMISSWDILQPAVSAKGDPRRHLLLVGLTSVALLVEMTSGFGFGGLQLILMIVVPSFGLAAAAVYCFSDTSSISGRAIPVALLIGLVTSAVALLIDPDELVLVLAIGKRDLLHWALYASFVSAALGWLLGLGLILFWPRVKGLYREAALKAAAIIAVALGGLLYAVVGQPGFYGEELFVILKEQAELTEAETIADIDARRAFVYETLVNHADTSQAELRQALEQFDIEYRAYYLVNGLAVRGGPLLEMWLASRPEVDRVLQSPVLRPLHAQAGVTVGDAQRPDAIPWNLEFISADRVWSEFGVSGEGIDIGHADTGVDGAHPELLGSYRGGSGEHDYNWYDPWNGTDRPTDKGGHGTHTLGTILGKNTGIAPGAEWMGCTNLARNLANPSLYLECLQFMLAPFPIGGDPFTDGAPSLAADVLNNSWACPTIEGCDPDTLLNAARSLRQAGIFVVASAGNEGPFCESVDYPLALYEEVTSVGAVDRDGLLAFFSSVGPVTADGSQRTKPDILAPGVNILSAFPDATYEYLDGTSMAGPHVAGVVALMWSANPDLIGDIDQTEELLRLTARDYQGTPPDCGDRDGPPYNGIGYGLIDAYAAVEAALALLEQPKS